MNDGYTVAEAAQEVGVPVEAMYSLKQAMKKREERRAMLRGEPAGEKAGLDDTERSSLRREIELLRLKSERDRIENDLEFEREKRELELQIKRIELQRKRRELEEEDDDFLDDEDDDYEDASLESQLIGFFRDIARKNNAIGSPRTNEQAPSHTQTTLPAAQPALDVTKPLTSEQIKAELAKIDPAEIEAVKNAPRSLVKKGLKDKYPGITPQNVELIIQEVREWQ